MNLYLKRESSSYISSSYGGGGKRNSFPSYGSGATEGIPFPSASSFLHLSSPPYGGNGRFFPLPALASYGEQLKEGRKRCLPLRSTPAVASIPFLRKGEERKLLPFIRRGGDKKNSCFLF